ncbi:MAG: hypothetical protein EON91_00485 [Brevundimonas sp.]|uniref:hypothetical protein n=1 Tax=Brevundimonas sp. TaxID=1871086 RepID=UPI00121143A8|nr:hypothetical protein [Brevundimonas sp.]RZJ19554.1 MAG: hypothetical protein EON91_00485 [Brevundimonas sp.]
MPGTDSGLAFEAALEEAMAMMEQGDTLDQARFDELLAEIESWRPRLEAVPEDDPRADRARALLAAADALESASAHGSMDEVNSMLTPLMGKKQA